MPFEPKPPSSPDDDFPSDDEAWEDESHAPADENALYDQHAPIVSDEEIVTPTSSRRLDRVPEQVRLLALIVVLALVVLLIVRACGGRRSPAPAPVVTPSPTVAAQATYTPTPGSGVVMTATVPLPAPTSPTPPPAPGVFQIGQRVEVFGTEGQGIRFRTGPGLNYITTTILQDGAVLTVVGGPEEADGFTWWRLQMDTGAVGWAAAGNLRSAP
jgi:hypothetical protein